MRSFCAAVLLVRTRPARDVSTPSDARYRIRKRWSKNRWSIIISVWVNGVKKKKKIYRNPATGDCHIVRVSTGCSFEIGWMRFNLENSKRWIHSTFTILFNTPTELNFYEIKNSFRCLQRLRYIFRVFRFYQMTTRYFR